MSAAESPTRWVLVGRVSGVHGVRGWIKLFSYTQPRDALLSYQPWFFGEQHREQRLVESRVNGKNLIARLGQIEDRDQAALLVGQDIYVRRQQLPPSEPGCYYWADLIGLRVVNHDGQDFGRVEHLMETGSNDVLVVAGDRERLVPFVMDQVIHEVDLLNGVIRVDWDPDF